MPEETEFEAAIERLRDPQRFAEAERIVARAAPELQKVLAAALAEGGWFGEPHEAETLRAATIPDPDERLAAVRSLLAEEARMGMMVGVAVGWALKEEMTDDRQRGRDLKMEIKFHGHSCFEFSEGDVTVLTDPFLKPNNPSAVHTAEEVEPTHIAITPRPRRPHRRRGPGRQAHRRPLRGDGRGRRMAGRPAGSRTSATPTSAARSASTGAGSSWCPPGTPTRCRAPRRRAVQRRARDADRHPGRAADQPRRQDRSTRPATPACSAT